MVKDGSPSERHIESRLWDEGWASFRVAGSGTIGHPSADVVAIKNNVGVILEVKSISADSLPYDVGSDSEQLSELANRNREDGRVDTIIGFAVDVDELDIWRFANWDVSHIRDPYKLDPLYRVLNMV